ncbi:MAG: hypothetical protein WA982_13225 [Rubrobacteraceae bacterium]
MQYEDTEIPPPASPRSTRSYVVNDRRAEILAGHFPGVFSAGDVRERLEGEPVKKGLGLLEWAAKKRRPKQALRDKAKKDGLGHYRPRGARDGGSSKSDVSEEYRRYMAFVERKQEESVKQRGRFLLSGELEDLAREFYAPEYRADLEKISPEAWEAFHRGLEAEEELA